MSHNEGTSTESQRGRNSLSPLVHHVVNHACVVHARFVVLERVSATEHFFFVGPRKWPDFCRYPPLSFRTCVPFGRSIAPPGSPCAPALPSAATVSCGLRGTPGPGSSTATVSFANGTAPRWSTS